MRETRTEKNYISKDAFRRWVKTMHEQFLNNTESMVYRGYKNYTYVYLRSKVGIARCNPNDKWDGDVGIAYAWARCTGQPVYYEKEEKYIPKAGEWAYIHMVDGKTRYLMYISEGIDSYCFKTRRGTLTLINKDKVIKIRYGE